MVYCKIVCASPFDFVYRANQNGIDFYNLSYTDALTLIVSVRKREYHSLMQLAKQFGATIQPIWSKRNYSGLHDILKRPILVIGLAIICLMSFLLPSYVLFVTVKGNQNVPERLIIDVAERCGLYFGAVRSELRSEHIKNEMLAEIPQLQWIGVNTYGCIAEITVKENSLKRDESPIYAVSSIVSARDGIVCDVVTIAGSAVCSVGQAVTKGQLLISGFTDCGISIKAEQAKGAVFAYTLHEVSCFAPAYNAQRTEKIKKDTKFSLKFGKNIINLYINSGISDGECVKIFKQENLRLPGGFELPISLVYETEIVYKHSYENTEGNLSEVSSLAEDYLMSQMINGTVLNRRYLHTPYDDAVHLKCTFFCKEMIGRERKEELPYGK